MTSQTQLASGNGSAATAFEPLYRISEVARMLHISRAMVYKLLRGERIIDLAGKGTKGVKLIPASVLREILNRKTKTFR
jgi:predicted transcriptional regulator